MVTIVASTSSVCSTIFAALQQAIIKRNITAENSARAQSLLSSIQGASLVIAPSVGALLIGAFGYQLVFTLNAGSFLFGIASALFVASNQVSLISRQSFWADTKSGIKLIIENAKLQPLLILSVTNAAATGALGILYIQHFTNVGFDIQAIALFMASQGIGVFVGSRYFTNSTLAKSINPAIFSLLSGASLVGVSQLASFHQAAVMAVLIIAGITAVLLGISLRTLVQEYSKVENIGRITSLISLGSVIGSFASLAFVTTTSVYLQPSVQLHFLGFLQVSISLALLYFKRS
jgi:MFS family permease